MPTAKNQSRRTNDKTICQKSTEIAANIARASSLYLARITLGPPMTRGPARASLPRAEPAPAQDPMNKRLVESGTSPNPSYLIEPERAEGVDGRATEFINRFREKTRSDAGARSELAKVIPPPPKHKLAAYYGRW